MRGRDREQAMKVSAEEFVHLYVDEPKWLRIFLMYVLREGGRAGPAVADTLLELLLREWARTPGNGEGVDIEYDGGASSRRRRDGGGSVSGKGSGRWDRSVGAAAARKQREGEIMSLLDNPRAGYDADHALALVQMLDFKPGQLYLYEKVCSIG